MFVSTVVKKHFIVKPQNRKPRRGDLRLAPDGSPGKRYKINIISPIGMTYFIDF